MVTQNRKDFCILGLMSGTSLDGLDMALCNFYRDKKKWKFMISKANTVPYPEEIRKSLKDAHKLTPEKLIQLDHSYGRWIAVQCQLFLESADEKPSLIASHGHTIFHQPEKGFTVQIGNGNDIAAITSISVVYDFRSMDVALGGSGAPLVPAGDEYLFPEYEVCLNLGGFSNISYKAENRRIAFDICPVNIAMNYLAQRMGYAFDHNGDIGRKGIIIASLLTKLNDLSFYKLSPPRSLMREWFEKEFIPILSGYENNVDVLRTIYEHIAYQITEQINKCKTGKILVTGGGARNIFLISLLKEKCKGKIIIPDDTLVDFKEALVFGFLGLLRYLGKTNCYSSVTGAERDSSAGVLIKGHL